MPKLDFGVNAGVTGLPGQQGGGMGINPIALNPMSMGMNALSGALSGVLGSVITQSPAPAPKHHHEEAPPAPEPPPSPRDPNAGRMGLKEKMARMRLAQAAEARGAESERNIAAGLHAHQVHEWKKYGLIVGGVAVLGGIAYALLHKKHR